MLPSFVNINTELRPGGPAPATTLDSRSVT